ncbi:hypothetical protein, partial [Allofournierella massiliensis]|uniref:hypothetical protein n=1 Tax=Allofournierella massiliensis TaxID=1650663 RepID=UPI0024B1966C
KVANFPQFPVDFLFADFEEVSNIFMTTPSLPKNGGAALTLGKIKPGRRQSRRPGGCDQDEAL